MRLSLRSTRLFFPLGLAAFVAACTYEIQGAVDTTRDDEEVLSGGKATAFDSSRLAFGQLIPGVSGEREDEFFVGHAIFDRPWVSAPASVTSFDGLGPYFNATSCAGCHVRDGRGAPPEGGENFHALLLRVSIPGADLTEPPKPDPVYGGQIQGQATFGIDSEAKEVVEYAIVRGTYADGEPYELRKPSYSLQSLAFGPLAPGAMLSPRIAPGVYGAGLLEAIDSSTLEAFADPDDRNRDGISGRLNYVKSASTGQVAIGRFGWKAGQPSVLDQSAAAFNGDMGLTSSLFQQDDCSKTQTSCAEAPSGNATGNTAYEVTDALLKSVVHYQRHLAVPARRDVNLPQVQAGRRAFFAAGCQSCHIPKLVTGAVTDAPELSKQTIRPFTDLLLHDMGEGLADGRPEYQASGTEWKTPPLWGAGLTSTVNKHQYLLHDGRARGFAEAILWHDGEALRSRDAFRNLPKDQRDALLKFLQSL
jgi:CxxC motif-containing protein (DUF1111 family)